MKSSLRDTLHGKGLRCTEPRRCILQALAEGPKTHAELLRLTELDRVTVYRNLIALQRSGLIYRVYLPGQDPLYVLCDGDGPTHAHFFCQKCHKATCLPAHAVQIAEPWTGQVEKVLLLGRCSQCA
ncbi:MAG: transcriptional repressor [Bacteroidia bacterium]|nr:transcriptional repressor [Bacteroidia bacterium]